VGAKPPPLIEEISMTITHFIRSATIGFSVVAGLCALNTAIAEEFPSKTIEVVTHAGAGGGTDVTTRMMMLRARRELAQDMVILNKKGGGGAAAMEYYKTVPSDGYTILTFTVGHAAEMTCVPLLAVPMIRKFL